MKARTAGQRVITLIDGTKLVPTHDAISITDKESKDAFTLFLEKKGEIVFVGSSGNSDRHKQLMRNTTEELQGMCDEFGIEYSEDDKKSELVDKIIAHENN